MASYCESDDVTRWLPGDPVTEGVLTADQITDAITRGSNRVETMLPQYWPFPDVGSTPDTPEVVREAASHFAAAICLGILQMANVLEDDSSIEQETTRARDILVPIRDGIEQVPRASVTAETLSYGDGDPQATDVHKFTISPKDVIPESVRITDLEWGIDFWPYYDQRLRGWVVQVSGAPAGSVSYDYTYLRVQREVLEQVVREIDLYRG